MSSKHSIDLECEAQILPTDPDLINFFRLCRIVLEDIPDILRYLFVRKVEPKYKQLCGDDIVWNNNKDCGAWLYSLENEKFKARLSYNQVKLLKNGDTNAWDVSLLVQMLLYSSQFFLVNSFQGNEMSIKQDNPSTLISTCPETNLKKILKPNDILLIDIVGEETIRADIRKALFHEIITQQPIKAEMPEKVKVYHCGEVWHAVNSLAKIRNTQFAHCRHARISTKDLDSLVESVEKCYRNLEVHEDRIDKMMAIKSGTNQIIRSFLAH